MPPVLAAIPLALAAAGTAAAGAAVTGVGVAGAAGLAASLDIGLTAASAIIAGGTSLVLGTVEALLAPKAPTPVSQPTQLTFQQDPVEQRSWCYGTGASAGSVKYWETTGDSNNTVWYVSAVHDTPCDSFTLFFIDHDAVDFDPDTGDVTTAKYIAESGPKMWRYDHLGLHNQDADGRSSPFRQAKGPDFGPTIIGCSASPILSGRCNTTRSSIRRARRRRFSSCRAANFGTRATQALK
jgi:hypothetical protein